jgi:hypothetical protein
VKRAYGSEPILLNNSPITAALKPGQGLTHRKRTWIFITAIALFLLAAGAVWIASRPTRAVIVPTAMARRVSFPVYQPTWLPESFLVNHESFDATRQVLTFAIKDRAVTRLVFTEQPKPAPEQINAFYAQQLSEVRTVPTEKGEITLGRFEGMSLAGITTEKTWILIRAVAAIEDANLQKVAESITLVPVD